jgi:hypothetical protein
MGQVPKRPLGNTGLHVSVLGFGASPLGGVFHVRCSLINCSDLFKLLMVVLMSVIAGG